MPRPATRMAKELKPFLSERDWELFSRIGEKKGRVSYDYLAFLVRREIKLELYRASRAVDKIGEEPAQ